MQNQSEPTAMTPSLPRPGIRALILAIALGILLLAFSPTWSPMIHVWQHNDTFAHGYLVLPFSLWMIFARRREWTPLTARTFAPAMLLMALCAVAWTVAALAGVLSIQQYSFVGMLIAVTLLLLGTEISRIWAVPLLFLFFMVPFGDFLVPGMMKYTAAFAVYALRLSGIPVYQEGMHIYLPSGHWSVIEACAGLRYLIASFVLGVLFAYLTYRSTRKRLVFIGLAILVPVLANWIRAYLIILAGHFSDMKMAAGIDHLVYGWLFFGLVIGTLFWIGRRWRDDDLPANDTAIDIALSDRSAAARASAGRESVIRQAVVTVAGIAIALLTFPAATYLQARTRIIPFDRINAQVLESIPDDPRDLGFKPSWGSPLRSLDRVKQTGSGPVAIAIRYFAQQHVNGEMIRWRNFTVANDDDVWMILRNAPFAVPGIHEVREIVVQADNGGRSLLIWDWFMIAGTATVGEFSAKMLTAGALLSGKGDGSAVYVLSTPINNNLDAARARLRPFVQTLTETGRNALDPR